MVPEKGRIVPEVTASGEGNKSAHRSRQEIISSSEKGELLTHISCPGVLFCAGRHFAHGVVIATELLILSLLLVAVASHFLSNRESGAAKSIRERYGIPYGRVIYSDLDRPAKALFSRKWGISGKPDYIISDKRHGCLIPIEIKSGRAANPHKNHVMQLAAYCLLVEENYHKSVPYGIIVYADGKQHKINFDKSLRDDLIGVVKEMKRSMRSGCPKRGHDQLRKCSSCSFQSSCRYCLADT